VSSSNGYKIIIESRGNKLYIYYDNSAIYCRIVDFNGKSKETILVSNVYENFFYTKSHDDNIYLLCEGKAKNYLFLTYDNNGWHIEELNLRKDYGNITPLELFALTDGIHIVFAKKLLLENYFDLYLLKKSNNEWEKSFICEIYSKTLKSSEIIKMTGYNNIHLISTLYDGQSLTLSYFLYDAANTRWSHNPIVNLNYDDLYIITSVNDNNLNLFCYNYENKTLNIYYFSKHLLLNTAFSLIDIIKLNNISKDIPLIIDIIGNNLVVKYIHSNCYHENIYSITAKQWTNFKKVPLYQLPVLNYVKIIKDISYDEFEERKNICSISDTLEIGQPYDNMDIVNADKASKDNDSLNNTSLILNHMNLLTEKIEDLSRKLNELENKKPFERKYEDNMDYHEENQHIYRHVKDEDDIDYHGEQHSVLREHKNKNNPEYSKEKSQAQSITIEDEKDYLEEQRPMLKHSNFREKFMNSKPRTIKLDSSPVLTGVLSDEPFILKDKGNDNKASDNIKDNNNNKEGLSNNNIIRSKNNYEEVLNNITNNKNNKEKESNSIDNSKIYEENTSKNIANDKNNKEGVSNGEHPNKPKGFIKTVAEWFRE